MFLRSIFFLLLLSFLLITETLSSLDRLVEMRKFISKDLFGIEIAPWGNPILPKSAGWSCITLDLYDAPTLRMKALADPNYRQFANQIEEVDLLGSVLELSDLIQTKYHLETFDYVVSSHNFEHLPNPILFLQECSRVLKKGGLLSMAIPDLRVCFDYFRPHTSLAEWLEAFFSSREKPTLAQVFEHNSLRCRLVQSAGEMDSFPWKSPLSRITPHQYLKQAFDSWSVVLKADDFPYIDVHCSVFTPASFELLLRDLQFLGLSNFSVQEISSVNLNEFYVHLRNDFKEVLSEQEFYNKRAELLRKIVLELKQR